MLGRRCRNWAWDGGGAGGGGGEDGGRGTGPFGPFRGKGFRLKARHGSTTTIQLEPRMQAATQAVLVQACNTLTLANRNCTNDFSELPRQSQAMQCTATIKALTEAIITESSRRCPLPPPAAFCKLNITSARHSVQRLPNSARSCMHSTCNIRKPRKQQRGNAEQRCRPAVHAKKQCNASELCMQSRNAGQLSMQSNNASELCMQSRHAGEQCMQSSQASDLRRIVCTGRICCSPTNRPTN